MVNAIEIADLSKSYNNNLVLKSINLTVKQGEFVAIMGSSGSGKTTLLNILSCLDKPSSGDFLINNHALLQMKGSQLRDFRAKNIGLVFQQFHLVSYLSVLQNVLLAQFYHSTIDKDSAIDILRKLDLADKINSSPNQLSGGQQQRVCIARSLINNPSVLLADEPTGNLDAENESIVMSLLNGLNQQGKTVIMVTHSLALAKQADRIINLEYGELV